jgi:hypothetical protein
MVKVNISNEEIQALDVLIKDAKMPSKMGYVLEVFKQEIVKAFQEEQKAQRKDQAKELVLNDKKLLKKIMKEWKIKNKN